MAENFAPYTIGKAVAATVVPSGAGVVGELYQDKEGNLYRLVHASDEAIANGQLVQYKDGRYPTDVIVSTVASGVGEHLAGVAKLDKESDGRAEATEAFFICVRGKVEASGAGSIVIGDPLTAGATNGTVDVASFDLGASGYRGEIGTAVEANDTANPSGIDVEIRLY